MLVHYLALNFDSIQIKKQQLCIVLVHGYQQIPS